jgi:NAD(P)-dependent dehydrogenase (short-subunit alcohol dehydrogenase family)
MSQSNQQDSPSENRAVLVTGCSSGIGRATALHLARHGFTVFAGVRKEKDAHALRAIAELNLIPLCPLDLTRLDHIRAAHETVIRELSARGIEGLYAIVNNAGGGGVTPIELMDLEGFRTELGARLLGPVALLQEFLPDIRQAHGRIVWIGTPGLFPVKYVAGIHAADFAVNCLARTLSLELKPWDIPNILVRCGGIATAAPARGDRELGEAFQTWPPDRLALYRDSLLKERRELAEFDKKRSEPEVVAKVVRRALVERKPKSRYQAGYMSGFAALLELLPQTAVDAIMAARG